MIAGRTQKLDIYRIIRTAVLFGDDMVFGHVPERKILFAAITAAILLRIELISALLRNLAPETVISLWELIFGTNGSTSKNREIMFHDSLGAF